MEKPQAMKAVTQPIATPTESKSQSENESIRAVRKGSESEFALDKNQNLSSEAEEQLAQIQQLSLVEDNSRSRIPQDYNS
jgi:hypothetical protein